MPKAIFLIGPPASGKTTFYQRYLKPEGFKHITTDTYVEKKAAEECKPYKTAFRHHIITACKLMAVEIVKYTEQKLDICIDLTNMDAANRYKKIRIIQNLSKYEMVAVHFNVTPKVQKERLAARGPDREIPGEVLRSMAERYEPASSEEGFAWCCLAENWEEASARRWKPKKGEIPF